MAYEELFERLGQSTFRSRFHLKVGDKAYAAAKGYETIRAHAEDFISQRLSPAHPSNDGKQTPMRGHPVFIGQHATATCCRGCLAKWHRIPKGKSLTQTEQAYVVDVLMVWMVKEMADYQVSEANKTVEVEQLSLDL